jgi:hypothetical protein
LKRRRRPPLAPMEIFTQAAEAANGRPPPGNGEAA